MAKANEEQLSILNEGPKAWNAWRQQADSIIPDLREADLVGADLYGANLSSALLSGADLRFAELGAAELRAANLAAADLSEADLSGADLSGARLVAARLVGANLAGADLHGANLSSALLNGANLSEADLTSCRVYGVSAWNLQMSASTKQHGLIITAMDQPEITVDDIEVAQFLYLLIHNEKLRKVIDTITSKVVIILGRFSVERKAVLDAMRNVLRERDLLPIIFDFSIPASRSVTETVKVLAGLASFVIADITDATEVRAELHGIVPLFPSLAVQPIILRGQSKFVSMSHLEQYRSMLPSFEYDDMEHLLASLDACVVARAEAKVRELQRPQPTAPEAA
jgi:hypothetical protein